MTNARQVKKLVAPLLARNPDLILSEHKTQGYELCLVPVRHVLRHIWIQRVSMANHFGLQFQVTEMFRPEPHDPMTFGWCFDLVGRSPLTHPPGTGGCWYWADPTMAADFVVQIEERVLPVLRPLDTVEAFIAYARQHREWAWSGDFTCRTIMEIVLGNLEAARAIWAENGGWFVPGNRPPGNPGDDPAFDRYCALGAALMADDRAELARLLHAWEGEWVAARKLSAHWQPTPFPFERAI
ncbi:hypothetical protein [Methylobacterium symbioticum]|uniref:Uncharacterized protein n=1 Tax=Methylobacterium symbioticum TaxID=2584084 RepID=A0A509EFS8_9HYPH|nr:hypothetical protein [Methylobacterium symbioticum]VUD73246.1 hypothetical protein MET9862_03861 [Methylobacterium symbioticum]